MHQPSHAHFVGAIPVPQAAPARSCAIARAVLPTLLTILRLPARILAIRRALAMLGGMDDRELSDIGLCRQDLRDATALPLGRHPDTLFRERVAARRRRGSTDRRR